MKFAIYVSGLRPAHSKEVNNFLANLDLGISGAYVKDSDVLHITLKPGLGVDHIRDVTIPAVIRVYEQVGWVEVQVHFYEQMTGE